MPIKFLVGDIRLDITSPHSLWKDYDVSALPLNVSALSNKTENGKYVKEYYFDGFATVDGKVRAYMDIAENPSAKGIVLFLGDNNDTNEQDVNTLYDLGYTVASLDYLGINDKLPHYTLYPKSLDGCNCRGANNFSAPEDALNSNWFVWTCIGRKAVAVIKYLYPQSNIFAVGKGLGGNTVYKLGCFDDGLCGCATLLNILPEVSGTGNKIINYRAALDNSAYAKISKVPLFISIASNDEDGSFDEMAELAQSTDSLKCFRIVERGFSGSIDCVYDQIDRFFCDCSAGKTNYPKPTITAVNSENNLYLNTVIHSDNAEENYKISLYVSFCIENPKYRNWMGNIPAIKLGNNEYMSRINVVNSELPIHAFINITDSQDNVVSSPLLTIIPKTLKITSHPGVYHRRIYDSGMGKDVWSSPKGGSIEIKSGPFGIDGVWSSKHSLVTFKPNDLLFKTDPETLLQIIAFGKPQTINIKVADEVSEYNCQVNITNSEEWHKFTLNHLDFKSSNGPLTDWFKIVMLELHSDDDFIVSSVLWV